MYVANHGLLLNGHARDEVQLAVLSNVPGASHCVSYDVVARQGAVNLQNFKVVDKALMAWMDTLLLLDSIFDLSHGDAASHIHPNFPALECYHDNCSTARVALTHV